MTPEEYERLQEILVTALELPPGERSDYLQSACGSEQELLAQVGELLQFENAALHAPPLGALEQLDDLPVEDTTGSEPVPAQLGEFEIGEQIGAGGVGEVYAARQTSLGRDVALKLLRAGSLDSHDAEARFVREARLHGSLEHPAIAPVHHLGFDEHGGPYFTMKRVRGASLLDSLRGARQAVVDGEPHQVATLRGRLDVFRKVCDGVAYAHSRGVIHRDLKPANIMIGEFGEVQVMDWGLARLMGARDEGPQSRPADAARPHESEDSHAATSTATLAGSVLGTPAYMSPEQAFGETDTLDQRSDVYSLGALLYSLVSFQVPFRGTSAQVLEDVRTGAYVQPQSQVIADPELAASGHTVPGDLAAIVRKAMAHQRGDRYATVTELRAEVDLFLEGRFVQAGHYTWRQRLAKLIRLHRRAVQVAGLLLMLGLCALVAGLSATAQARRQQVQDDLTRPLLRVAELEQHLAGVGQQLAAGKREDALAAIAASSGQDAAERTHLLRSELLKAHRSDVVARLRSMPERLASFEREALHSLVDEALATGDSTVIERAFDTVLPYAATAARLGVEIGELPLASAHMTAIEIESLENDLAADPNSGHELVTRLKAQRVKMARHAGQAWTAAPSSRSAVSGLLLLAEDSLRRADSIAAVENATAQHFVALSLVPPGEEGLRLRCLLALARCLLRLEGDSTPFTPQLDPVEAAIRCLARIVDGSGSLWPEAALALRRDAKPPEELQREAADLLEIARLLLLRTPLENSGAGFSSSTRKPAWLPDPWRPGILVRLEGPHLLQVQVRNPEEMLAAPVVDSLELLDLSQALAAAGLRPDLPASFHPLPQVQGGAWAAIMVETRRKPRVHQTIVLSTPGRPTVHARLPAIASRRFVTQGDTDGDGLVDLVFASGRGAATPEISILFGAETGGYSDAGLARPPRTGSTAAAERQFFSLLASDLDSDGRDEIVTTRGGGSFPLQVYRVAADRSLDLVDQAMIGTSGAIVCPGDPPCIAVTPQVTGVQPILFEAQGWHMPSRPRVFTFLQDKLVEQDSPWRLSPSLVGQKASIDLVNLGSSRQALVTPCNYVGLVGNSTQRAHRWLCFSGSLSAPLEARTYRTSRGARSPRGSTPGAWGGPGEFLALTSSVSRRLSDAELAVLAQRPLPTAQPFPAGTSSVTRLARLLLGLGHPVAAGDVARDALEHIEDRGLRTELLALRVRSLREAGEGAALLRLCAQLEPADDRAELFLAAAQVAARMSGRYEEVASQLRRWTEDLRVSGRERERIDNLNRGWEGIAPALSMVRARLVGRDVVLNQGERSTSLADYWIGNDPWLAFVPEAGPWRLRAARPWLPSDRQAPGGAGGVAVRLGREPARISIEFTCPGRARGGKTTLQLTTLEHGRATRGPTSISFGSRGLAGVLHVNMLGAIELSECSSLLGSHLRADLDFLPPDQLRARLWDVATGNLLKTTMSQVELPVNPRIYLLGVRAAESHYGEIDVHSLELAGGVQLVRNDVPEVTSFLAEDPLWRIATAAMQHRLLGDDQTAAAALTSLADHCAADDIEGAAEMSRILVAEAMWLESGREARPAAERFEHALQGGELTIVDLLTWCLVAPQHGGTRARWQAVGGVRTEADLDPGMSRLFALAREAGRPGWVDSLAAVIEFGLPHSRRVWQPAEALSFRLLGILERVGSRAELPKGRLQAYERALQRLHRRDQLVQLCTEEDAATLGGDAQWRVEQVMHQRSGAALSAARAEVVRSGQTPAEAR